MSLRHHFKSVSRIALGLALTVSGTHAAAPPAAQGEMPQRLPTAAELSAMCLKEVRPYQESQHSIGMDEVHLSGKMSRSDNFRPMTPKIKAEVAESFKTGGLNLMFSGAVEAVGPHAQKPPRILVEPHLWWKLGETSRKAGDVMIGAGVEIWHNKYGKQSAYDIVPEIGIKISF